MKLESVAEVIAERTCSLLRDDREPEALGVILGRPQNIPNHTDFYCTYEIEKADFRQVRASCGLDAFQAMPLVRNTIGVELKVIQRDVEGRLVSCANDKGDLGFPNPDAKKE